MCRSPRRRGRTRPGDPGHACPFLDGLVAAAPDVLAGARTPVGAGAVQERLRAVQAIGHRIHEARASPGAVRSGGGLPGFLPAMDGARTRLGVADRPARARTSSVLAMPDIFPSPAGRWPADTGHKDPCTRPRPPTV